jgi:hypothetical protein
VRWLAASLGPARERDARERRLASGEKAERPEREREARPSGRNQGKVNSYLFFFFSNISNAFSNKDLNII